MHDITSGIFLNLMFYNIKINQVILNNLDCEITKIHHIFGKACLYV